MSNDNEATTTVDLNRPTTPAEATLAAAEHLASEIEKGKALLKRLPENPSYSDLRDLIWANHQRLHESAGLPVSLGKGDNAKG